MKYVLGLFCVTFFLQASETEHRWAFSNPENLTSGRCYEVQVGLELNNIKDDEITKYFKSVDSKFCRPGEVVFVFDTEKGNCFEADKKSRGKNYLSRVETKYCRPSKVIFRQMERKKNVSCYEADEETNGENYFFRVDNQKCIHKKLFLRGER